MPFIYNIHYPLYHIWSPRNSFSVNSLCGILNLVTSLLIAFCSTLPLFSMSRFRLLLKAPLVFGCRAVHSSHCIGEFPFGSALQAHLRIHFWGETLQLLPMLKVFCPFIWVASTFINLFIYVARTFKNSFWGETVQLLPMFKEICPFMWVASTFKNSF
jgi:hypothetical protein